MDGTTIHFLQSEDLQSLFKLLVRRQIWRLITDKLFREGCSKGSVVVQTVMFKKNTK